MTAHLQTNVGEAYLKEYLVIKINLIAHPNTVYDKAMVNEYVSTW